MLITIELIHPTFVEGGAPAPIRAVRNTVDMNFRLEAGAPVGGGNEQRPDRAVDDVVAGVEQASLDRGGAEAAVEIGGDGHVILLRKRRTPEEAAWRAASGLESSAAAICS